MKVFSKITGAAAGELERRSRKGTYIEIPEPYDVNQERIAMVHARNQERLSRVFAQAAGEVRRLTGLTLLPNVPVDEMALNKALSSCQDVQRKMRLKSMLYEIGAIAA